MTLTVDSPWILNPVNSPKKPRLRLFCFSHAGGSPANYMSWQKKLAPSIEVLAIQLPGRGARFNEKNVVHFTSLMNLLAPVIKQYNDLPFVFFGHSLGAMIAFELCHHLVKCNQQIPKHLFVSGANPPSQQPNRPCFESMSDKELIELLENYEGTPSEVLEEPMLMELLLPAIRADFMLLNSYQYSMRSKLPFPLTLLTGTRDSNLSSDILLAWQKETMNIFQHEPFDGGHFYINSQEMTLLKTLSRYLTPLLIENDSEQQV